MVIPQLDEHIDRLEESISVSKYSDNPSTQLGVLLYFPPHEDYLTSWNKAVYCKPLDVSDKQIRHQYIEHAERAVIYQAARYGYKTYGAILYSAWIACHSCARAIIAAGIQEIYTLPNDSPYNKSNTWGKEAVEGRTMLEDAGVKIHYIETINKQPVKIRGTIHYV